MESIFRKKRSLSFFFVLIISVEILVLLFLRLIASETFFELVALSQLASGSVARWPREFIQASLKGMGGFESLLVYL